MRILRTRFGKDVVAEFLPPVRLNPKRPQKAVIFCSGMPSVPRHGALLEFFARKGFWCFYPRYRGSWESSGRFLKYSPEEDIKMVLERLPRGFKDLWSGKAYKVRPAETYLVAGSFGGPAGILLASDKRIKKVVAVSPVVEWRAPSKAEPLSWLEKFVRQAFGEGYRFKSSDWRKLASGRFYNPMPLWKEIPGEKLLIYHAKDDESVRAREVVKFAKLTGAKLRLLRRGGHLSSPPIVFKHWPEIKKFFKSK